MADNKVKKFCLECKSYDGYHFKACSQEPKKLDVKEVGKEFLKEVTYQFVIKEAADAAKNAVVKKVKDFWRGIFG